MSKYVAAKDLKYKGVKGARLLSDKGCWYDKKSLIKIVIDIIHGDHRRRPLEKVLDKLTRDDILLLGQTFRNGAEKEIEAHLPKSKDTI